MAKVNGPLFSLEASGQVGKAIVYASNKGRAYVRSYTTPANPKTALQVGIRSMFKFLSQIWASLIAGDQASYEAGATSKNISPFNEFMAANMDRWRLGEPPSMNNAAAEAMTPATVSGQVLTGGDNHASLAITLSTATDQWAIAIFRSLSAITTPDWNECIAVIPVDGDTTIDYVDSPLTAGTYHYRTAALTDDGVQGTAIADGTVVVT